MFSIFFNCSEAYISPNHTQRDWVFLLTTSISIAQIKSQITSRVESAENTTIEDKVDVLFIERICSSWIYIKNTADTAILRLSILSQKA